MLRTGWGSFHSFGQFPGIFLFFCETSVKFILSANVCARETDRRREKHTVEDEEIVQEKRPSFQCVEILYRLDIHTNRRTITHTRIPHRRKRKEKNGRTLKAAASRTLYKFNQYFPLGLQKSPEQLATNKEV